MINPSANLIGAQNAIYHNPSVRHYRGNPFIEALPPLLSRDEACDLMRVLPIYDDTDRRLRAIEREHLASLVAAIRHPTWLHSELYSRLSRLICNGYLSRNPASHDFQRLIDVRVRFLENLIGSRRNGPSLRTNGGYVLEQSVASDSNGLIFLGTSGIGKSKGMEMVLGLWPQLILHSQYAGQPFSTIQIPWMKLDVPTDGSVLAMADRFFITIDNLHSRAGLHSSFRTTYMRSRATETTVPPDMARVAAQVGLGLLVLDEVQDLSSAKSRRFLSFLVQLVNAVGVPVVLVGGLDAFHLVTEQFRQVRRGSTEGDFVVTHSQPGSRWNNFCSLLWNYQYTTEKVDMSPDHASALFDVSQGITELMVIAYKNAQIRAISTDRPFVTPRIIRSISDTLNLAQPALGALRRGSAFVIDRMSDLKAPFGVETQPFLRADPISAKPASDMNRIGPLTFAADLDTKDLMAPANAPRGKPSTPCVGHQVSGFDQKIVDVMNMPVVTETDVTLEGRENAGGVDAVGFNQSSNGIKITCAQSDSPSIRQEGSPVTTAPNTTILPVAEFNCQPTLLEVIQDGMTKGLGPRESLGMSGCGAGDLFWRIIQLQA